MDEPICVKADNGVDDLYDEYRWGGSYNVYMIGKINSTSGDVSRTQTLVNRKHGIKYLKFWEITLQQDS